MTVCRVTEFPLTGGCNCGAVRFEVSEPLVLASHPDPIGIRMGAFDSIDVWKLG